MTTKQKSRTRGAARILVAVAGLAAPAVAQPALDADIGPLTNGSTYAFTAHVATNEAAHWYRFTIPSVSTANGPGQLYLDLRTTNPASNTSFVPSSIGLYDAAGNFAAGTQSFSVDTIHGPGIGSTSGGALSYGATCPTRPDPATPPATVDGSVFLGRDGSLPAGTYYLAVCRDFSTYATGWSVTPPSTGIISGNVQVEIKLGTTGNPPPLLTGSSAAPGALNSGGTTLLTVTQGTCTSTDVPTSVRIDLSAVGGSATAPMYDDGTHGDVTAGDGIWSLSTPIVAAPGTYALTATASNVYSLTSTRNVPVSVNALASPFVKISQINTSLPQHSWAGPIADYIELHNTSAAAVDLTGWAIQTAANNGTTWTVRPLPAGFTVPANGYSLLQLGVPIGSGTPLSSPNNTDDIYGFVLNPDFVLSGGLLSSLGGKIALTSSQGALSGDCPLADPNMRDFVGYGSADCSEGGSPAPALSQYDGRALYRGCTGDTDTNNNGADFTLNSSSPRNHGSPPSMGAMTAVGAPTIAAAPSVVQNSAVLLTASAASCSGAPAGVSFTANLSFVGGPSAAPMYDDGTHGDAVAGDGVYSLSYTVPDTLLPAPAPGAVQNRPYVVPMTATDSLGRTANAYAAFYVTAAPTGGCCITGQEVSVRTQAGCVAAGGTYQGDSSSPFSTPGTIYTAANWSNIPNNSSASNAITVPDATTVNELVVHLDCTHGWLGDLTCTLNKGATTVTLFQQVGIAGNNATGRPGNMVYGYDYRFYDGGTSFWNAAYNGGKDTNYQEPEGWYAPSGAQNAASSLSPFIGGSAQGIWTLNVAMVNDVSNTGSFTWSLEVNPTSACPAACYPNCDGSTTAPILNVADFTCFLQKFAAANPYANCDQSTTPPVLNVADFTCFLQKFAAGCH
jgi:hypothetical protein